MEGMSNLLVGTAKLPTLKAALLIGGASRRMGSPKHLLQWQGRPLVLHFYHALKACCNAVWVIGKAGQNVLNLPFWVDEQESSNPSTGLKTAFAHDPDAAWLVVACDYPYAIGEAFSYLIAHRNPSRAATAFWAADKRPEPLLTIYEPVCSPYFASEPPFSLRRFLEERGYEGIQPPLAKWLFNMNTPQDYLQVIAHQNA